MNDYVYECWRHGTFCLFEPAIGCAKCGKIENNFFEKKILLPIIHAFRRVRYYLRKFYENSF